MGNGKNDYLKGAAHIRIDGTPLFVDNINDCLSYLLHQLDVKYSPMETLRENLINIFEILIEHCEDKKDEVKGQELARLTKMISKAKRLKEEWPAIEKREVLMQKYYDELLVLDGVSTLHGFRAVDRFGDPLYGNPERMMIKDMHGRL